LSSSLWVAKGFLRSGDARRLHWDFVIKIAAKVLVSGAKSPHVNAAAQAAGPHLSKAVRAAGPAAGQAIRWGAPHAGRAGLKVGKTTANTARFLAPHAGHVSVQLVKGIGKASVRGIRKTSIARKAQWTRNGRLVTQGRV
jgi:hypothetical protein